MQDNYVIKDQKGIYYIFCSKCYKNGKAYAQPYSQFLL